VIPVYAIYDYKKYYDDFIDSTIRIYKEELTNHGFRFEKVLECERLEASELDMFNTKVNYRKVAQDVTVDLRPVNPTEEDDLSESRAFVYRPTILLSRWIPCEATLPGEKSLGFTFFKRLPQGVPKPLEFTKEWITKVKKPLMDAVKKKFIAKDLAYVVREWERFFVAEMPQTENVWDFMVSSSGKFGLPLGLYLYGTEDSPPCGFESFHRIYSAYCPQPLSGMSTAFVGENRKKATSIDLALAPIVEQNYQTIPHRNNPVPRKPYIHYGYPEHLQHVLIERREEDCVGTVTAKVAADHDKSFHFLVTFKGKDWVPHEVSSAEYIIARSRYLSLHPESEDESDQRVFNSYDRAVRLSMTEEERERVRAAQKAQKALRAAELRRRRLEGAGGGDKKAEQKGARPRRNSDAALKKATGDGGRRRVAQGKKVVPAEEERVQVAAVYQDDPKHLDDRSINAEEAIQTTSLFPTTTTATNIDTTTAAVAITTTAATTATTSTSTAASTTLSSTTSSPAADNTTNIAVNIPAPNTTTSAVANSTIAANSMTSSTAAHTTAAHTTAAHTTAAHTTAAHTTAAHITTTAAHTTTTATATAHNAAIAATSTSTAAMTTASSSPDCIVDVDAKAEPKNATYNAETASSDDEDGESILDELIERRGQSGRIVKPSIGSLRCMCGCDQQYPVRQVVPCRNCEQRWINPGCVSKTYHCFFCSRLSPEQLSAAVDEEEEDEEEEEDR
jgi:hypothetical protein